MKSNAGKKVLSFMKNIVVLKLISRNNITTDNAAERNKAGRWPGVKMETSKLNKGIPADSALTSDSTSGWMNVPAHNTINNMVIMKITPGPVPLKNFNSI